MPVTFDQNARGIVIDNKINRAHGADKNNRDGKQRHDKRNRPKTRVERNRHSPEFPKTISVSTRSLTSAAAETSIDTHGIRSKLRSRFLKAISAFFAWKQIAAEDVDA